MNSLTYENLTKAKFAGVSEVMNYDGSIKTSCMSTILTYLGIDVDSYDRTSESWDESESYQNIFCKKHYYLKTLTKYDIKWEDVSLLWCVDEFEAYEKRSLTNCLKELKISSFNHNDLFIFIVYQLSGDCHGILFNGNGKKLIDTCPNSRWYVEKIFLLPNYKN